MTQPDRARGALLGLFIGDALAMPVHWCYDRARLRRDYGRVTDFVAPRNPHPDSILWRSHYEPPNAKGDILHDQARFWGRRGVHYHQFLEAGENTLTVKLCGVLLESLLACGGYDADDYLARYVDFMTTPGRHRDTYVEECHRHFFASYARGEPPRRCGARSEKHIGGLAGVVPVVVFHAADAERARAAALEHVALTHGGPRMEEAAGLVADLLLDVLRDGDLHGALSRRIERQTSPLVGHPFGRWLRLADTDVVGGAVSPACYVEDAVPATLYLALKYHDDPEAALIANTNLGGDNVHRGSVLGALLGAAHGRAGWPARWREGLKQPPPVTGATAPR